MVYGILAMMYNYRNDHVVYAYLVVCLRTKFFRAENNSHQTLCDDSLLRDSANEDVSEQSLVLLKSTSCWSKTR